jgi:bifunctional non-homologous end joining protein LigD
LIVMANSRRAEQLSLAIDDPAAPALPRRLRPMIPLYGAAPFDDADFFFEPWWPGTSALLYIEDGSARLETEHLVDPLAAFPELAGLGRQFQKDGVVVEGTLLALDEEGRPDADLLRSLLVHRSDTADERPLGTAAFVASDMLYAAGRPIGGNAFEERRARLTRELIESDNLVVSRGLRGEGLTLAEAVASMGLTDISARLLSGRYRPGHQDESWLRLPVTETPLAPRRPLLALLQRLPL